MLNPRPPDPRLRRGPTLIRHRGHAPSVDPSAFVAPTATLVGDVRIGPRVRVMYGAVLDAEGSSVEVGEASIISENAVLRATAVGERPQPVRIADHVFISPHSTLLGCDIGRCCYIATGATVLQGARLGPGSVVAIGAAVHARTVVPDELFIPPFTVAAGDPAVIYPPDKPAELAAAIRDVNFAGAAFGVQHEWTDRTARYERIAEVRAEEYAAHRDDEIL